jgi:hypothetical protein
MRPFWRLDLVMNIRLSLLSLAATTSLLGALVLPSGCSSSNGPSLDPNRTDCNDVCAAAAQCSGANAQSCSDKCTSKADGDSSYASAVKSCSDCTTTKTTCPDLLACGSNCLSAVTE